MMENRKSSLLGKLAVVLSFTFLVVIGVFVFLYFKPLAEPMVLLKANDPEPMAVLAGENNSSTNSQRDQEVCGNTGSMLVLLTGEDFTKGTWPLGADTVRVAKIDFSNRKIVVIGFPRDLWVKTPGLTDQNLPETRLGLSYHYKKEATNGSDKHKITEATTQIAQALYDNFGLEVDNYFTIQLQNTPEMIDAIGGIDIDVPEAFTTEYGVSFTAGPQHMDGAKAAEFARAWSEDDKEGDLLRFPRQNLLMNALQEKMLSADIITKVPDLYKQFDKSITTNLSPKQIADMACMAKEVPQKDIEFHEIMGDLVTEQKDFVLMPNVDKIKEALKNWLDL